MLQDKKHSFILFWHDLSPFSTNPKIVLSSGRGQGRFEDLQASRPRPRTSNCVLEDSTSDLSLFYYVKHQHFSLPFFFGQCVSLLFHFALYFRVPELWTV